MVFIGGENEDKSTQYIIRIDIQQLQQSGEARKKYFTYLVRFLQSVVLGKSVAAVLIGVFNL